MAITVGSSLKRVGDENLRPGDRVVSNDGARDLVEVAEQFNTYNARVPQVIGGVFYGSAWPTIPDTLPSRSYSETHCVCIPIPDGKPDLYVKIFGYELAYRIEVHQLADLTGASAKVTGVTSGYEATETISMSTLTPSNGCVYVRIMHEDANGEGGADAFHGFLLYWGATDASDITGASDGKAGNVYAIAPDCFDQDSHNSFANEYLIEQIMALRKERAAISLQAFPSVAYLNTSASTVHKNVFQVTVGSIHTWAMIGPFYHNPADDVDEIDVWIYGEDMYESGVETQLHWDSDIDITVISGNEDLGQHGVPRQQSYTAYPTNGRQSFKFTGVNVNGGVLNEIWVCVKCYEATGRGGFTEDTKLGWLDIGYSGQVQHSGVVSEDGGPGSLGCIRGETVGIKIGGSNSNDDRFTSATLVDIASWNESISFTNQVGDTVNGIFTSPPIQAHGKSMLYSDEVTNDNTAFPLSMVWRNSFRLLSVAGRDSTPDYSRGTQAGRPTSSAAVGEAIRQLDYLQRTPTIFCSKTPGQRMLRNGPTSIPAETTYTRNIMTYGNWLSAIADESYSPYQDSCHAFIPLGDYDIYDLDKANSQASRSRLLKCQFRYGITHMSGVEQPQDQDKVKVYWRFVGILLSDFVSEAEEVDIVFTDRSQYGVAEKGSLNAGTWAPGVTELSQLGLYNAWVYGSAGFGANAKSDTPSSLYENIDRECHANFFAQWVSPGEVYNGGSSAFFKSGPDLYLPLDEVHDWMDVHGESAVIGLQARVDPDTVGKCRIMYQGMTFYLSDRQ